MSTFTMDNTDGYSAADLDKLNAMYDARMTELRAEGDEVDDDSMNAKSTRDHVAECVLADYDNGAA